MAAHRGKTAVLGASALALGALALSGYVARDRIIQEWHLLRLRSSDPEVRAAAAAGLGAVATGRAVPALLDAAGGAPPVRDAAFAAILKRGRKLPRASLEDVLRFFEDPERVAGLAQLLRCEESGATRAGVGAADCAWLLLQAARSGHWSVHALGATYLPSCCRLERPEEAFPLLAGALHEEDVSFPAAVTLSDLDSMRREAALALAEALRSPSRNVRECAGHGLLRMGERAAAAAPVLLQVLRGTASATDARILAAMALGGASGPEASGASEALERAAASDDSPEVRAAAAATLERTGSGRGR
ncbi:MAG: HEAT repeat domain-containing protein [Planctomycetes bacterium]|nr:HEAT repeat domain-containing protein [Planctomycetota bacterium]